MIYGVSGGSCTVVLEGKMQLTERGYGGRLLGIHTLFLNLPCTVHTAYHTSQQPLETAQLAQGKLWATYESSEAVPHHLTVAWYDRRAARLLRQRDDCTAAPQSTY